MTRAPALRGQARRNFKAQRAAQPATEVPMPQQQQQQVPAQQPQSGALSGALTGAMQGYAQAMQNYAQGAGRPNPREQWLQQQQQQQQMPQDGGMMYAGGTPGFYDQSQNPVPMPNIGGQMPMDKMYRFPQPVGGAQMGNAIGAVAGDYQQAVVPDQSMQQQQFRRMPMPMPNRRLY
jgi:hypothetical protein